MYDEGLGWELLAEFVECVDVPPAEGHVCALVEEPTISAEETYQVATARPTPLLAPVTRIRFSVKYGISFIIAGPDRGPVMLANMLGGTAI